MYVNVWSSSLTSQICHLAGLIFLKCRIKSQYQAQRQILIWYLDMMCLPPLMAGWLYWTQHAVKPCFIEYDDVTMREYVEWSSVLSQHHQGWTIWGNYGLCSGTILGSLSTQMVHSIALSCLSPHLLHTFTLILVFIDKFLHTLSPCMFLLFQLDAKQLPIQVNQIYLDIIL